MTDSWFRKESQPVKTKMLLFPDELVMWFPTSQNTWHRYRDAVAAATVSNCITLTTWHILDDVTSSRHSRLDDNRADCAKFKQETGLLCCGGCVFNISKEVLMTHKPREGLKMKYWTASSSQQNLLTIDWVFSVFIAYYFSNVTRLLFLPL